MESVFYQKLSIKEKRTYDSLVDGFSKMMPAIPIATTEKMEGIVADIMHNHPELFYLNQKYMITGGALRGKALQMRYQCNERQRNRIWKQVEDEASRIVSQVIRPRQSEYDKVLALHDFLKSNIRYNEKALKNPQLWDAYTVVGALIDKNCVCQGFAAGMKLLCDLVNVVCFSVSGYGHNNLMDGPHAWNIVRINGFYYHVDVTWDNQFGSAIDVPNYTYLNLNDQMMAKDHEWDQLNYPPCFSTAYNYFVLNRALVESMSQLERLLIENIENEEETIIFKVAENSALSVKMPDDLEKVLQDAGKKSRYASVNGCNYTYLIDQLVFLIRITYL